jgi:hypothetical protein
MYLRLARPEVFRRLERTSSPAAEPSPPRTLAALALGW